MILRESGRPTQEVLGSVSTSDLTTLAVGGPCLRYAEVHNQVSFEQLSTDAKQAEIPILIIGEGGNVLFSDEGFKGLLIQNRVSGRERMGREVELGGGENLSQTIQWLNRQELSGMEKMFGIPGTVAGALVGNAGAYGQEIGDVVTEVDVLVDGELRTFSKRDLKLQYRHSTFKVHPGWFIVRCRLNLQNSREDLQSVSEAILTKRRVKYPDGLKCPGSFFKNVRVSEISAAARRGLPEGFVLVEKIPAGKLLEAVGAQGVRRGDAQFADDHGNLIINRGHATSEDILSLANGYAGLVLHRFRIRLEPEILIVDDSEWPYLRSVKDDA